MSTATFTEVGHSYLVDGEIVPSVTQVLSLAGISDVSGIPVHILNRASAIGTAVHQACEYLDRDDLILESLDPQILGYVVAYQKFKEEHKFVPDKIEHRGIGESNGLRFGYCIDRTGTSECWEQSALLDIKTSSRVQPSWAIQTAAYSEAIGHEGTRIVVHVSKDGTYKVIPHKGEDDYLVWRGALTVAHWKLQNGAKLR